MKIARIPLVCVLLFSMMLSACGVLPNRSSASMHLSAMLAPVKDSLSVPEKKPLILPASVAILMVPPRFPNLMPDTTLSKAAAQLKKKLLENRKYVSNVTVVTPEDKQARMTLAQLAALYGADIVITLSYEQDQRSSQSGFLALMDATIIGDFIVPGIKLTTTTYVDGKVIHVPSNAIIFRLSGSDERTSWSTRYVAESSEPEQESIDGLVAATQDFGNKLSDVLVKFDHYDMANAVSADSVLVADPASPEAGPGPLPRVPPAQDQNWNRVDNFKHSGGALDPAELALLLGLGVMSWWRGRVQRVAAGTGGL